MYSSGSNIIICEDGSELVEVSQGKYEWIMNTKPRKAPKKEDRKTDNVDIVGRTSAKGLDYLYNIKTKEYSFDEGVSWKKFD